MKENIGKIIVESWKEWMMSNEGEVALEVTTLGAPPRQAPYLKNRLQTAFIAGFDASQKLLKKEGE